MHDPDVQRATAAVESAISRSASATPDPASFVLSLDTELLWGSFHRMSARQFETRFPDVRNTIRGILSLLDRYEISASWAVVGHLFLDRCERSAAGIAHANIVHPKQSWWSEDWYSRDPCTDRWRDHLWYGSDILDMIQGSDVEHEIGSHSFAHPHFGNREMTREAAAADLDACIAAAEARGIRLRSFVFPGNSEGHHELLRERGFIAYRGTGREELRVRNLPATIQRPVRLATQVLGVGPLTSGPAETLPGLWDIPASTLLMTRSGLRRAVTRVARLRRIRAGIASAMATGGVFHLWTHPWNLADDPGFHLEVLEQVLAGVVRHRDAGYLRVETMGSMAARLSEETGRRA